MYRLHKLSLTIFLIGILAISYGILLGDIQLSLFIIFPIISGSGPMAVIGFICIIIACFLYLLSFPFVIQKQQGLEGPISEENGKTPVHKAGIVLIGPIPIIIGSHWKITLLLICAASILLLLLIILHVL